MAKAFERGVKAGRKGLSSPYIGWDLPDHQAAWELGYLVGLEQARKGD